MNLDWTDVDMGSVPAWAGALSLVLALSIFIRDRRTNDRAQVDAIGIWWEAQKEFGAPGDPWVEEVKYRMFVRNGSNLPAEMSYLALGISTKWMVPVPGHSNAWDVVEGTDIYKAFAGPIVAPPDETVEHGWVTANVAHLAPEGAVQLDPLPDSARVVLRWSLITDNAGRRWQTRHNSGKRAKRIRWWSRHDPWFPYAWKNPVVRRYWETRNSIKDWIKRG